MASLTVLRVKTHAVTASFRYPRVQVGKLPSFNMPPPATVYGHLASVLGEWFEPAGLTFAYTFRSEGKGIDVETAHPIECGSGRRGLAGRGWDYPINVECNSNAQRREFLCRPRLTLYLTGNDALVERFALAFHNPYYSYVLGRSQDLATCMEARFIELGRRAEAFFSDTILPYDWRPYVFPGTSVVMPEVIDYTRNRNVFQQRYLQVIDPPFRLYEATPDVTDRKKFPEQVFTEPEEQVEFSGHLLERGLHFFPVKNAPSPAT